MSGTGPALSEFLSGFLAEAEELLVIANRELLAAEEAARGGNRNGKAVREAFRAVHTIKGLAAMVEIEPIVGVAHRLESILRISERDPAPLESSAIDVLLEGLGAIQKNLQALVARAPLVPASPALLERLEALQGAAPSRRTPVPQAPPADPLRARLEAADWEQIERGRVSGRRALSVEFVPTPERATQGITITSVREALGAIGELVRAIPISRPGLTPGNLAFAIVVLTDRPVAEVAAAAHAEVATVHELDAPQPPDAPVEPVAEPADEDLTSGHTRSVVRVETERLDEAIEGLSALIVTRFRLATAVAELTAAGANTRALSVIVKDTARQLRDLRATILRIRMVHMTELLERVPLLVRGLCRATGKRIRTELDSGGAELDKKVAEAIFPALVHLTRNAVDHAIEAPAERLARGKPEEGLLRVTCVEQSHRHLEITVADDGAGIDRQRVAARANKPVPHDDLGLLNLICLPGLSTRDATTTTSGRGMGMDIVRRVVVDQLGGELSVSTQPGRGTTFTLRVPLTITTLDAFSLEAANQRFVVPVAAVEEIVEIEPTQVIRGPSRRATDKARLGMIERRGEAVPVIRLDRIFEMAGATGEARKALIVRRAGAPVAFAVDRLLGQHEVVVRPLEDPLVRVPGVAGSTDLGDGRPTLVLDLPSLAAQHLERRPRGPAGREGAKA